MYFSGSKTSYTSRGNIFVHVVERRNPSGCETLKDKKHRIVCYLCEMVMQLCLRPSDNISSDPGCEAFALVYDKGYDDVNMYLA